jgi:hypothetical protein
MHAKLLGPDEVSTRARKYLATLEKRVSIPIKKVEDAILATGNPCFPTWLDFHEKYSGYLEWFGNDWAIWGLVHPNSVWLEPNVPDIEREPGEETFYIRCADTHPSFNYRLDQNGTFLGGKAENFGIFVERVAVGWEFAQHGKSRILTPEELRTHEFRNTFEKLLRRHLIHEASDRFSRYYMDASHLVIENVKTEELVQARILSH